MLKIYVGVDDIDIWEMDDHYRTKNDKEKFESLGNFSKRKK